MRVVLISTYDLGRQPFGLASPRYVAAGGRSSSHHGRLVARTPSRLKQLDELQTGLPFTFPMHTATRMAVPQIQLVRQLNPSARICCYGLYAPVNEEMLRTLGVTHVIGGEFERALTDLISGRATGVSPSCDSGPPGHSLRCRTAATLPVLREYAGTDLGR